MENISNIEEDIFYQVFFSFNEHGALVGENSKISSISYECIIVKNNGNIEKLDIY